MVELLDALASWQTLVLTLLVFGLAPRLVMRLIVLAYPKGDQRRRELIAELQAVPRIERPLWVIEQFEAAAFDGLGARRRARTAQRRAQTRTSGTDAILDDAPTADLRKFPLADGLRRIVFVGSQWHLPRHDDCAGNVDDDRG